MTLLSTHTKLCHQGKQMHIHRINDGKYIYEITIPQNLQPANVKHTKKFFLNASTINFCCIVTCFLCLWPIEPQLGNHEGIY